MNREAVIKEIWGEKRGREPIDFIPPLGVSISLPNPNVKGQQIIYGLLDLLRSDPTKAFEWSATWGRTVVSVHPNKGFDFRFSILKSTDEKTSSFVQTSKLIDPQTLFDEETNIGKWTLVLNRSELTLEGAIIQIERMVDELVWCNHLQSHGIANPETYRLALEEVWNGGVRVDYASEDDILRLRAEHGTPVRIYGDVLKSGKVPTIVGTIIEGEVLPTPMQVLRTQESVEAELRKHKEPLFAVKREHPPYSNCATVATAVAGGKPLHIGHYLTISLANMIAIRSGSKLYLEESDTGDRVFEIVAKLAELHGVSVEEAISSLMADQVDVRELHRCYKNRADANPELLNKAKQALVGNSLPLFRVVRQGTLSLLHATGLNEIETVPDSGCQNEFEEIGKLDRSWQGSGFGVVKFKSNKSSEMVVLQKNGEPTAPAMRAAFILKVCTQNLPGKLVFVDAGDSVRKGIELAQLYGAEAKQVEGVGIGFELEIGSSTKSNIPSIEKVYNRFEKEFPVNDHPNLFQAAAAIFLFTRCSTAQAHKDNPLAKGHRLSESFYDYKTSEDFLRDFILCGKEALEFKRRLDEITLSEDSRVELAFQATRITDPNAWESQLPRCVVVSELSEFQNVRTWLQQKAYPQRRDEVDVAILGAMATEPNLSIGDLSDRLRVNGITSCKYSRSRKDPARSLFFENLRSRGYSEEEAAEKALLYFRGEHCLVKKLFTPFEFLQKAVHGIPTKCSEDERSKILEAIVFCRTITHI